MVLLNLEGVKLNLRFSVNYEVTKEQISKYLTAESSYEWIREDAFVKDLIESGILKPKDFDLEEITWES
jgi:hypothetical protein